MPLVVKVTDLGTMSYCLPWTEIVCKDQMLQSLNLGDSMCVSAPVDRVKKSPSAWNGGAQCSVLRMKRCSL